MFAGPGLLGNFNHHDICWRDNTAECKQSRRFLESNNNLLTQVVEEQTRKGTSPDLLFMSKEAVVGHMKVRDNHGSK